MEHGRGEYVSTTLREKDFDPKGKKESTFLDDMVNLIMIIVIILLKLPLYQHAYPNRMEREAMILSSYAGILMHSLPVEDVFDLYGKKQSKIQQKSTAKV
ncbi:hypothetical protein GDO86_017128 [Hymenochirus boettgeri]|uniref:Uncharacterized protein n=1 Tax=Hymenochirus boettgeri TaxID=247094 RepID=A0A8T2IIL0_9PIPI|nr:hypothetical protein GDO86_017128 [Hymenochirus boettgeri]